MKNKDEIKIIADEILETLTENKNVTDIVNLANSLGFTVGNMKSQELSLILSTHKEKIIGVNNKLSFEEKRYLIACELGNYLLSKDETTQKKILKSKRYLHKTSNISEMYEDNIGTYFASCLLMPEENINKDLELLKEIYNQENGIYIISRELKNIYKIPELVMLKRIKELEITKEQSKNEIKLSQRTRK